MRDLKCSRPRRFEIFWIVTPCTECTKRRYR